MVNMLSVRNLDNCTAQVRIRARLEEQTMVTLPCDSRKPVWNHVMRFVTAEPFEYPLILTMEECLASKCVIPLDKVERRSDDKEVKAVEFYLERRLYHGFAREVPLT